MVTLRGVQRPFSSQLLFHSDAETVLGRLSSAGTLVKSSASQFRNMRVLGSYAMVYLVEGSGFYRDAGGTKADLQAGDLLLLFPEIAHRYGPRRGERWSEIYAVFSGPLFEVLRKQGVLEDATPITRLEPISQWRERLESTLAGPRPRTVGEATAEVMGFAHLLTQMLSSRLDEKHPSAQADWLAHARYLLDSDLEKRLQLEAVARECGFSYESFRKRFASEIGISPARYRAGQRMTAACALLDQPGTSVKAIARALGFSDEFHFAKRFKQVMGSTPRGYRHRQDQSNQPKL